MSKILVCGKSIFSGRSIEVSIVDGIVASVSECEEMGNYLSPGFFDLQLNGYISLDYSTNLAVEQVEKLIRKIASSGTTKHLPTIITNTEEQIISSIKHIMKAKNSSSIVNNAIPGFHIEGPFISSKDGARGVHNPKHIRRADLDEFLRWQDAAEGLIKIVTLSPEDDGAIEFIHEINKRGVIPAIGHTAVSGEFIDRAIDAGAKLSTHIGNGCPAFIPRLDNFVWKQISDDRLSASLISDGFHLPSEVLKSFSRIKQLGNTILVSDAAALAGNPPGLYKWGDMDIRIFNDGHMGLNNTTNLAGASLLLDRCISNMTDKTDFSLEESVMCATTNPSRLCDFPIWNNEPIVGETANLTSFNMINNKLNIGKTIYQNDILFNNGGKN
ncbi:MAG: hypothetical protein OCD02_02775 [Spirochaetaceae bacterium]